MNPDNIKPCRGCRAPMEWWKNPETGKSVPLDVEPRLMIVDWEGKDWGYDVETMVSVRGRLLKQDEKPTAGGTVIRVRVSHFRTCPQAGQFSKGRK